MKNIYEGTSVYQPSMMSLMNISHLTSSQYFERDTTLGF